MNASESTSALPIQAPVIGITPEDRDAKGNILLPCEYVDAVLRAGGLPLILPVWRSDPVLLLDAVDGLILAGGGDIDPALYGGKSHPAIYSVDRERDATEISLARLAKEARVPLLGICRGAQVVNVALGGKLIEHLEDGADSQLRHRAEPPAYVPHPVQIREGSLLAQVLEVTACMPLSWHHQAIRSAAPALAISACAPDGTIEAVESADHPFFLAVQWHPEMTAGRDPCQQRLFDALVAAARSQAQERASPEGATALQHSMRRAHRSTGSGRNSHAT